MDIRAIVKEMIKNGMTDEEILQSLRDLGVENVEDALAQALAADEKEDSRAKPQARAQQMPASEKGAEPGEVAAESDEALGEPLFGETKPARRASAAKEEDSEEAAGEEGEPDDEEAASGAGQSLFSEVEKPTPAQKQLAREAIAEAEIPKLEITKMDAEGEKKTSLEEMLGKPLMDKMPAVSLQDLTPLEKKLDDAIALLKSVQEINQKILEANRDVLLKLKTQK